MTDQDAEQSFGIKITGACDTPGCDNEATVHYGLEEFYCLGCHEKNAATQARLIREYQEYSEGGDTTDHLIQPENRPQAILERESKDRETKAKWLRVIFEATWPRFCRSCGAWGVISWTENHGPGLGEQMTDACSKCEDHCPRCGWRFGEASSWEDFFEDSKPCPECKWNWGENDGDTCPEFDLP